MKAGTPSRGFSLFEMMIVIVVMMIIMAIALPTFMTAYRSYQLGAAIRDVSNIIGRARYEAVRRNTPISTIYSGAGNLQQLGVDLDGNLALDANEPRILVPRSITLITQGNSGPFIAQAATMGVAYQNQIVPANFVITFTERGTLVPLPGGIPVAAFFIQNVNGDRAAVTVGRMGQEAIWRATAARPAWHQ